MCADTLFTFRSKRKQYKQCIRVRCCWHRTAYVVYVCVVSASDVTPTDRWLNVWCIWYTSGVSKSSSDWLNYTGFPGDLCVVFFNVPPGNKDAVAPNPLTKEESCRVYNCDDKRLSGSTTLWIFKVCEIFKVRGIESLKYVREFHTPVCYCGDISTHRNVMLVKRPHGRALANKSCHLFQTFSRQSEGLATRD